MSGHDITTLDAEAQAADLLKRGYVEVQEWGELHVGDRVRNTGQRWSEAIAEGTATIERIFHKPDSAWEAKYGRPDVEIIAVRDKPDFGSTHGFWADYHTVKADQ